MKLYCNESGFTGNHLLDNAQEHFAYTGICIDDKLAASLTQQTINKFNINSNELKGQKLLRFNRGRKAILWIFHQIGAQTKTIIAHKKYALASKFFEYIFEPVIRDQSSIFYDIGFHKYLSNILYLHFSVDKSAQDLFLIFENLIRNKNAEKVNDLFLVSNEDNEFPPFLRQLQTFIGCNINSIESEIAGLKDCPVGKWALDLSLTALYMFRWGGQLEKLSVYCDKSKPLEENKDTFDIFVEKKDTPSHIPRKEIIPTAFNLTHPIQFVDSKETPGIQLADVISSSIVFAIGSPHDEFSKELIRLVDDENFDKFTIFPEPEKHVEMNEQSFICGIIFSELVERSIKKQNICEGLPEFIHKAKQQYYQALENELRKPKE